MQNQLRSIDQQSLLFLTEYRVLTVKQISILDNANIRSVRRRMFRLVEQGFVTQIIRNISGLRGRPEHVFHLSVKGIELLKTQGVLDSSLPSSKFLCKNGTSLEHQLSLNWVLIAVIFLERKSNFKVTFLSHPFTPSESMQFIPDAAIAITHLESNKALLFFVEVDRSTESLESFENSLKSMRCKITKYQRYFQSNGYKQYEALLDCGFR